MSDFDVATEELVRLAKKVEDCGKALGEVANTAQGLNLPNGAFGRVRDSDAVHGSYVTLKQRLVDTSKKGSTVLDGVDDGLRAVGRRYSDQDATVSTTFEGK